MTTATADPTPYRIRSLVEVTTENARTLRHVRHLTDAAVATRPTLRVVDDFGAVRSTWADLPDAREWVTRIALALYEASVGARPAPQVMRFLAPEVYDSIVRRSGRAARAGRATRRPVRIRRVRATPVSTTSGASVVEACVVLDDHQRVRVMALRLEGLDGRWLVTACEIG